MPDTDEDAVAAGGPRFKVVRLSAVNDGVCDCCGGEDEWGEGDEPKLK